MKFAKYLEDEVVPEWRKAYIDYKQGKRYLKAIEKALDQLESEALSLVANSNIPAHPLETTGLEGRAIPSSRSPQTVQYDISPSQYHFQATDFATPAKVGSSSNSTTPILASTRGHTRNYSTIANPSQPSNQSAMSLPASPYFRGSLFAVEDDRSGVGSSTICDATAGPARLGGISRVAAKTASRGSQFGQLAFSQSSYLLQRISRHFLIGTPDEPPTLRTIRVNDSSFDDVLEQLLPEEREFFQFLDAELVKVNDFYREKELEAVTKLKVIKQQLLVANEWKRRYDENIARAETEHGWYAAEWSKVVKGIDNFIRSDDSVTENVTVASSKRSLQVNVINAHTSPSTSAKPTDPEQGLNYRDLRGQGGPPEGDQKTKQDVQSLTIEEEQILYEETRKDRLNHKVARARIKAVLYEFYRSLEMIRNYKVLNHTGFAKILKKFDKTAGWASSKSYMNSKLKFAYFMTSCTIDDLIKETEDVFIENFERGHRGRGMAKLRIPDSKNQTHHFTTLRIGLYLGLAAPLLVQGLQSAFSEETSEEIPYWEGLLLVYAGLFLVILFACLFGINMYVWAKSRINYKFIFEFDPRDNLDYHEYFELPIFLMLLLSIAVYFDFGSKLTAHVATAYWPLILMIITGGILFNPFPIAHFTSRRWFISSMGRILASGFYPVEFRDFFLADEMNSLSYSIEQFEFAMCAYSQQWDNLAHTCSTSYMMITPFLTALPAWFRFLQCLRRYRDTLEWFPHLVNAGKYSASLITLFVYSSYRHYGGNHLKVAYICISFFTSIYTFTWDVYMDWGLFRFGKRGGGANGHPFLRQELVYSNIRVYYIAIVLDLLGRFSWIFRLIPMNVNAMVLSFTLALIEVLRRWQWNFFRLENEHLNNCGQFRAIKDIPLPFQIRVEEKTDGEDDEEETVEEDEEREEDVDEGVKNRREYERHGNRDKQSRQGTSRSYSYYQVPTSSPPQSVGHLRTSSSHSSLGRYSNSNKAHRLSIFGAFGGEGGTHNKSRTSVPSTSAQGNDRSLGVLGRIHRKYQSQNHIYNGDMDNRGDTNDSQDSLVELTETGIKNERLLAFESGASSVNKSYGRGNFDSKINDGASRKGLLRMVNKSMPETSLYGLQSLGGGRGSESEDRFANDDRRVRSQLIPRNRRMSLGERVRTTIFGVPNHSEDGSYFEDSE
ncbi:hypothetical protein BGX21_002427 [Mortierella sp. AD011]|nr:hypothetical protein BGX20_004504 [Mortierella sp. AD010]KAF9401197.1 hypothetical protein BGX21_002427 [Mortierella sp. AD011]